jgi:hypothetical protein
VDRDEIIRVLRAFEAVQKFRSIEEMSRVPIPAREGDFDRFLRHCARYWAIAPRVYPRGVFRFRTLDEAQKARRGPDTTGITCG